MVDERKFEALVKQHTEALYRYCYLRVSCDSHLADEVYNDVLLILYRKWAVLDKEKGIRTWLYKTANHCAARALRKKLRRIGQTLSWEELREHGVEPAVQDVYFDSKEPSEAYYPRLEQALPEEYREIFRQRFLQKRTLEEVARNVGLPYSTLRLRLMKIEKLVRREVERIFSE